MSRKEHDSGTARPLCSGPRSIVIHGGRELRGEVPITGYKHALTVVVAAAVAMQRSVTLRNVPDTTESRVLDGILRELGADSRLGGGVWRLDTRFMRHRPLPVRLSAMVHGSLYLVPALLARFGEVSFAGAGGDRIGPPEHGGSRPTEQVVAVLERFGATVDTSAGLYAVAPRLIGCTIDLMEFSSDRHRLRGPAASSATKTALILACVAAGRTTLRHPVDRDATRELCDFLQACGVTVTRDRDAWAIEGGPAGELVDHHLISDSTEIVTFVTCAVQTSACLRLTGITGERTWPAIDDELRVLQESGVPLTFDRDSLEVWSPEHVRAQHLEIDCNGFSTDAHPLLALALLASEDPSSITDHVWTSRFAYAELLTAMGAQLRVDGNTVHLARSTLRAPPGPLYPTDSRAAAVAVLAGLGVPGVTMVEDAGHLDRSYERLVGKLRYVGARIEARYREPGE
jgi:UDP-N-acetylglucosamine 1-carboxyvinyltransferase